MPKTCPRCHKPTELRPKPCRECRAAYQRNWQAKNPDKVKANRRKYGGTSAKRTHQLKWRLKKAGFQGELSPGLYNLMLQQQHNECASCGVELLKLPKRQVHLDHCHKTSKIRGILCHHCNAALGFMGDDPDKIRKLAKYIESHR